MNVMDFLGKQYEDWNPAYYSIRCNHGEYTVEELKSHDMPGKGLMIARGGEGLFYGRPVMPRSGRLAVLALESVLDEREPRQYVEFSGFFEPAMGAGNSLSSLVLSGVDEIVHIHEIRGHDVLVLR